MDHKGYLFIGNSSKPSNEQAASLDIKRLGSVSKLPALAVKELGYTIFMGINRLYPEKVQCADFPVVFYDQHTYRSVFAVKDNWIAFKNLCSLLRLHPEIEIIHCNTPIGGFVGRLAGRKYKVKYIVYTAHGLHFFKGAPLLNRTIFKWIEQWLAHYTDAIITMNKEDYEAASKFHLRKGGKVYKIPGVGIDTSKFRGVNVNREKMCESLGIPSDSIIAIAMGDIVPRKNYRTAIEAISRSGNKKLHYLICGEGPQTDSLIAFSEKLGIKSQIHFLGYRTDIRELVNISDLFLFSSLQEGLPRSTMEAMSAGLPCIVSKIRGHVDLVDNTHGGLLIPPRDVDGFAQAIDYVVSSKSFRDQCRSYNLERIKSFDNRCVFDHYRSIFRDILSRTSRC